MKLTGNTVLITGGATGIGFAMAKALLEMGNTVIICGRRADRLIQAKEQLPALHIRCCDVTNPKERETLFDWVTKAFPDLNVLINNAGIQRDIDMKQGLSELTSGESEIAINLEAPIELCARFTPFLKERTNPTIINVSSGLAFMPERAARMPVYCATKAGLHGFCLALRMQLKEIGIEVIEAIPPAVISELNIESRRRRGAEFKGLPSDEYVDQLFEKIEQGENEIRILYPSK